MFFNLLIVIVFSIRVGDAESDVLRLKLWTAIHSVNTTNTLLAK